MIRRIGLLVGLVGCAVDSTAEVTEALYATCPSNWCAANSPEIGHYGLWELGLDHQPNDQGFVLLGASLHGQFYDLDVHDGRITLLDGYGGSVGGSDLWGATIWLQRGKRQYGVILEAVGGLEVFPGDPIETYILDWANVVGHPLKGIVHAGNPAEEPILAPTTEHVCPTVVPSGGGSGAEWDESWQMVPYDSLVFEGDRIHADYTVDPTPDPRWFNIGCAHHTLAKLRITRSTLYTVANSDWHQVQATLKFLGADYCGRGMPFTVAGTPIVWRNDVGMSYQSPPHLPLEARWDHTGALCLNVPRLAVHPDPSFMNIKQSIADECTLANHALPHCDPDPYASSPGELIISANH